MRFTRKSVTALLLVCFCRSAQMAFADPEPPVLSAAVNWIGDTFPGEPLPRFVPLAIDDISVSGDGVVATNSGYNEVATSVVLFKDGQFFGSTGHQFGGLDKRSAVAADPDNRYLFYSLYRRLGTGVGRVLSDGKTDPTAIVQEVPHTWPDKGFSGRIITGLALRDGLLFVSDDTPGVDDAHRLAPDKNDALRWKDFSGVSVVDAKTLAVLRSFPLEKPGKLAATHDGNVWVVQGQGSAIPDRPSQAVKLSGKDGSVLARMQTPMLIGAIAVDKNDRLLVADMGKDNNLKIFSPDGKLLGNFGDAGGIFAGPVAGVWGAVRFERPRGLGVDSAGNLYVLCTGAAWPAANRIESYAPAGDSWGALRWQVQGMMFGDAATFDPENDDRLYTSHAIFKMDWSRPPGQEWSYYATTLDRQAFHDDPRRGIFAQGAAGRGTFGIRVIHGKRFLFSGLNNIEVTRFDAAHGAIGIPSAYVCLRDPSTDRASADWPRQRPKFGGWTWHDANGDGQYDPDEFEPFDTGKLGISGVSDVDALGNIWWFPIKGGDEAVAHVLPPDPELDAAGNVVFHAANVQKHGMPDGFYEFGLCHLDDESGDLYVAAKRTKADDYSLIRYPRWREQNDVVPAWAIEHVAKHIRREIWMPNEQQDIGAIATAGDSVFVAAAVNNGVRIFRKSDGVCIGRLATPLSHNTTMDDTHGFHVHRRANGEYVLIVMDFLHNKNLMYRWKP